MASIASWPAALGGLGRAALDWLAGWARTIRLGALILVLALSPSSYRAAHRPALARNVWLGTAPILPWFTLLSALISLVVIRIVIVTALSYDLTRYALEMVVRVLVLELIPLTAALFAALRCTIPDAAEVAELRARGGLDALRRQGLDPIRSEVMPRVLAGVACVLTLAAVSGVLTLVLAYLSVYGFTPWGFDGYTRTVGRIFDPATTMIFVLKTGFLALVVSLIPMASVLDDESRRHRRPGLRTSAELRGLVRMFLLIEAASLVGNYS